MAPLTGTPMTHGRGTKTTEIFASAGLVAAYRVPLLTGPEIFGVRKSTKPQGCKTNEDGKSS